MFSSSSLLPDNAALVARLQALLQDDELLAEVAARSYLHVNQFVKIPLARDADSVLRLHLWRDPSEYQQEVQNPHSHGWAFRSRVVCGSLTHTLFSAAATTTEDEQYTAYELDLAHPDGTTKLRAAENTVGLAAQSVAHIQTNDTYFVSRVDIHTLVPDVPGCITLVQTERAHDDAAFVYGRQPTVQLQKRPSLSAPELRGHLRQTISRVVTMYE